MFFFIINESGLPCQPKKDNFFAERKKWGGLVGVRKKMRGCGVDFPKRVMYNVYED